MNPDWESLIKAHTQPTTHPGAQPGTLFALKRGIVAMSVRTQSFGSGRPPRAGKMPFLFHTIPTPPGTDRITLDLSHQGFLIFRRTETYSVPGQTEIKQFVHKHCIPWENILQIEFVESVPRQV
jgi:hypothetical protein